MTLESTLRNIQATMYTGIMTVRAASTDTQDAETGIVDVSNPAVITNQPCRISYKTVTSNDQSEYGTLVQEITLYCDPTLSIAEGSKITVTQEGITTDYQLSGKPAVYKSHQEIPLKIYEEYA